MIEHLSLSRLAVLLVVALVVFGPDKLPEIAAQVGRTIRTLRATVDALGADVRTAVGPEITSLDPRSLLSDLMADEVVVATPPAPLGGDAMELLTRPVDLSTVEQELAGAGVAAREPAQA